MKGLPIFILAILTIFTCAVLPVTAADENQTKDQATVYYNIAEQLLTQNQYETAITMYDLALASNTTMINMSDALLYTYRDKAYALIQLEEYDTAIKTVDLGLSHYPKDGFLWNNKGYALFRQGNYAGAVTAYDQIPPADNVYVKAQINRGDALYRLGKFSEAIDSYNKVLEQNPGNPNATAGLALAETAVGNSTQTTVIVLVIVIVIVAGGTIYYLNGRKPAEQKTAEKGANKK